MPDTVITKVYDSGHIDCTMREMCDFDRDAFSEFLRYDRYVDTRLTCAEARDMVYESRDHNGEVRGIARPGRKLR
jgi:hypothetical protein